MKKILAVLMSAMLLLGILVGCDADPTATEPSTDPVSNPLAAGILVLNANGTVNITYDADGLVMQIESGDDNGAILVGEYDDYLGKTCSDAVCDLIAGSAASGFLTNEVLSVMIKQAMGSALPGSTFLESIVKNAEAAIAATSSQAVIVLVTEENLDENGYINLETAKNLILASLGLKSFDTLDGTESPIDGLYSFAVAAGDLEGNYIVDAVTGDVYEGELDDAIEDDTEDDMIDKDIIETSTTDDSTTDPVEEFTGADGEEPA